VRTTAQIIDQIYATIRAPDTWTALIGAICDWQDGAMALLSSPALPSAKTVPLVLYKFDMTPVLHETELLVYPEFALRALATGRTPGVFLCDELMPAEEQRTNPYWLRIMAPLGIGSGMITVVRTPEDDNRPVVLNIFRRSGSPPFTAENVAAIEDLLPHLRRALGVLLDAPPDATSEVAGMYPATKTPAFYLDRLGRVVHSNDAAQKLIARGDIGLDEGQHLDLPDKASQLELNAALSRVIGDSWSTTFRSGAEMLIKHRSSKRSSVLIATPVSTDNPIATFSTPIRCIVFVLEGRFEPDAALAYRVQRLYGLTAAEAEIAISLATGKTVDQVADERGTKRDTVRTQLKHILTKTSASNQSALTGMIVRLRP
jgi:DNA-binding CsgD family transcriptional regulator